MHATRAQCERLDAELRAMAARVNAAGDPWRKMRLFGDRDPERCMEHLTSKQIDCAIEKYRADDMDTSACNHAAAAP